MMVAYINIINKNYIIPSLGEYILKMSSKSDHNCKSLQSPIDFMKKCVNICFLQNLSKYQKKKASMSDLIFETNLETNISTQKNKLFYAKE